MHLIIQTILFGEITLLFAKYSRVKMKTINKILRILKFFCEYQLKENKIISRQFVKDLLLPELLQFY